MATITKPVKICDILKTPVKEGTVLVPFQVGTRHFEEVCPEAIARVNAYIDRLGEPKAPRAPRAKKPIQPNLNLPSDDE